MCVFNAITAYVVPMAVWRSYSIFDKMIKPSHKCQSLFDEAAFHNVVHEKSFSHLLVALLCSISYIVNEMSEYLFFLLFF